MRIRKGMLPTFSISVKQVADVSANVRITDANATVQSNTLSSPPTCYLFGKAKRKSPLTRLNLTFCV